MDYDNYEDWLTAVDKLLTDALGMGVHDLPDRCWRDHYDDGTAPQDALDYEYDGEWDDPAAMMAHI